MVGVHERPADAFEELRRDVGIADIRRRHALLQLDRAPIVADLGGLVGRSIGDDDQARHAGSSIATPTAQPGRA
jgi:hypothetical protein